MLEINLFITTTVYDCYNIIGPTPNDAASTCLNNVIDKLGMDIRRASKSPDFSGDLPIFDKIMKISRSPDLE